MSQLWTFHFALYASFSIDFLDWVGDLARASSAGGPGRNPAGAFKSQWLVPPGSDSPALTRSPGCRRRLPDPSDMSCQRAGNLSRAPAGHCHRDCAPGRASPSPTLPGHGPHCGLRRQVPARVTAGSSLSCSAGPTTGGADLAKAARFSNFSSPWLWLGHCAGPRPGGSARARIWKVGTLRYRIIF